MNTRAPRRFDSIPVDRLDPDLAAAILEVMGLPQEREIADDICALAPKVRPVQNSYFQGWNVDGYMVRSHSWGRRFDQSYLSCQCMRFGPKGCPHIAAMMLAEAWNDPLRRPLFEQRPWEMRLGALVRDEPGPAPAPPPDRRHRGWVRYHLLEPREELVPILRVHREVVRIAKNGSRELKPQKCPRGLSELERKLANLTDVDRSFHRLNEQIEALLQPYERYWRQLPQSTIRVIQELEQERFALLTQVADLRYKTEPVRALATPFVPQLRVYDDLVGVAMRLKWSPSIDAVWDAGFVLVGGETVQPLAEELGDDVRALLQERLPGVPLADAGAFLERFALKSRVRVALESEHLPATQPPDRIEGRLMLREEAEELVIAPRFAYRVGAGEAVSAPASPAPLLLIGDTGTEGGRAIVQRDDGEEAARMTALRDHLPSLDPVTGIARLGGDEALDFLADHLPTLREGWTIFGESALLKFRYRGAASPRVSVPSETDWFDMKVDFTVGEHPVPTAHVLKSWIKGDRYHRLGDGTLARLPVSWLEKHGAASAELEELRKASRGRLGAYAAPVVADLLPYASGDTARWREVAERLGELDGVPDRPPPPGLRASLRAYQLQGYRWMAFLRDLGLAGILADDMGLGKTVQTLALLLDTHQTPGPASVVVAPTSVIHNWASEARRFTPDLKVRVFHGPKRKVADLEGADVVVTSYALLRLERELFGGREWRYLVLDEAQAIKNPASQLARAARATPSAHRLALTGTPMENHLLELWSAFEFLMPGFFGARAAFTRRYAAPIQKKNDLDAAARLRTRLRPFMLRRLKSEVASELPPLQEQVLSCELGPAQRRLYESVKQTYRESVLGRIDADGVERSTLHILEALTRLRQACCEPSLLPFDEAAGVTESAKVALLFETLEQAVDSGHRTLIFSQWPRLLKKIRVGIDERGWTSLYLDGSTRKRAGLVDRWNDPAGPPIFLISLKAGGTGLNLTGADHVIHMDPWWNPAVERQATDRAHRIGQTRPVVAYKLVARDTVEEKILELQDRKRALFEAAVDDARLDVSELTRADIEAVFAPEAPA